MGVVLPNVPSGRLPLAPPEPVQLIFQVRVTLSGYGLPPVVACRYVRPHGGMLLPSAGWYGVPMLPSELIGQVPEAG